MATKTALGLGLLVGFALAFLVSILISSAFGFGVGVLALILASYGFVSQAICVVGADPPQVIIVTLFGRPTNVIKSAGWRLLPFQGLVFGSIPVEATIVNEDLGKIKYFTGDNISGEAPLSFSYQPLVGEDKWTNTKPSIHALRNYLDIGKKEGVLDIMTDKLTSAFVQHMRNQVKTWDKALGVDYHLTTTLLKAVTGERVPSSVPTAILQKHFGFDHEPYTDHEKTWFPAGTVNFGVVVDSTITSDDTGLFGTEMRTANPAANYPNELKELVKNRFKNVRDLRAGQGTLDLLEFGIRLVRLNIGERTPDAEVAKAAAQIPIETLQQKSEMIQARARVKQAQQFKSVGLDAIRAAQTDAGTLQPNVHIIEIDANKETADALGKIAGGLGPALTAYMAAKGNKKPAAKPAPKKGGNP